MENREFRKGVISILVAYLLWGVQPAYWIIMPVLPNDFLMASRIVWAAVFCVLILMLQGKMTLLKEVFTNKQSLIRETAASFFLAVDWIVYLVAVRTGHVLECCFAYYLQPVIVVVFGAIIFHEKIELRHILTLAMMICGVVFLTQSIGSEIWITIVLTFAFAIYAAIKKGVHVDDMVGTSSEIVMMVPFAFLYMLLFCQGESGLGLLSPSLTILLVIGGTVTALPMLFYGLGVRHIPMVLLGIMQYLSPTLSMLCGLLSGETITGKKLVGFLWIVAGVVFYVCYPFLKKKQSH